MLFYGLSSKETQLNAEKPYYLIRRIIQEK